MGAVENGLERKERAMKTRMKLTFLPSAVLTKGMNGTCVCVSAEFLSRAASAAEEDEKGGGRLVGLGERVTDVM